MIISKQRLIEICERFGFGMTINDSPTSEITLGFSKIGKITEIDDKNYQLEIDLKYEDLFV